MQEWRATRDQFVKTPVKLREPILYKPRTYSILVLSRSGKTRQIEKILEERATSDKVLAVLVSNEEGLPIASRVENKASEYLLSAMAATLLTTSAATGLRLGMGAPETIRIELNAGVLLIREVREHAALLIVLSKDANLPYFDVQLTKMIREIDRVLFPDLPPQESLKGNQERINEEE
jgi:predicted regulator of Ras-like GTPase activity (Roadblock/LC7/MglB family)